MKEQFRDLVNIVPIPDCATPVEMCRPSYVTSMHVPIIYATTTTTTATNGHILPVCRRRWRPIASERASAGRGVSITYGLVTNLIINVGPRTVRAKRGDRWSDQHSIIITDVAAGVWDSNYTPLLLHASLGCNYLSHTTHGDLYDVATVLHKLHELQGERVTCVLCRMLQMSLIKNAWRLWVDNTFVRYD